VLMCWCLWCVSNFENPTWRTAAILKIVIAPYLSREHKHQHIINCTQTLVRMLQP